MSKSSKLIEQVFIRPGRYRIGEDRFRDFSAEDLRRYTAGTKAALRGGLSIPVLKEHAAPGSAEGGPQISRDAISSGAGWLVDVRQHDDGSVSHVLEITDKSAADAIESGTIKFTSPEIVDSYVDGLGRRYNGLFRHVALTHKPRNPIQGEMLPVTAGAALPAMQFSLDDEIPVKGQPMAKQTASQLGESDYESGDTIPAAGADDPDGKPDAAPPVEENPDMPSDDGDAAKKTQTLEAIVAHLEDIGIVLPAECDLTTEIGLACLLTALKTKVEADRNSESDEADGGEDDDAGEPAVSAVSPDNQMQFDESNPQVKTLLGRLAAAKEKLTAASRDRVKEILAAIPVPSVRKKMASAIDAVQFDELGNARPSFTVEQVAALFDGFPKNLQFDLSDADVIEPDAGSVAGGTGEMTDEQAQREVDEQLARLGMTKPRGVAKEWVNTDPHQGLPVTVAGGGDVRNSVAQKSPARRQPASVS